MAAPTFVFTSNILTITTDCMKMRFAYGIVIHLEDLIRSNVFLDTPDPLGNGNYPGTNLFVGLQYNSQAHPIRGGTSVTPSNPTSYQYVLTYTPCLAFEDTPETGSQIVYTFDVDQVTGEIAISAQGTNATAWNPGEDYPILFYLPIMNFGTTGTSTLLGTRKIDFSAANVSYWAGDGLDSGFNSVPLAIGQNATSCFGVWTENLNLNKEFVAVNHYQNSHDHILLVNSRSPKLYVNSPNLINGGPWFFTVQSDWLAVVKRWRARFNNRYSPQIKYLWEKEPSWVRDVHCRYASIHWDGIDYGPVLTQGIPAKNILLDGHAVDYNGNSEGQIIRGQLTPLLTNFRPQGDELAGLQALAAAGAHYLGYWLYAYVDDNIASRLADGYVSPYIPEGWTYPDDFSPIAAYTGDPADWVAFWSDYATHFEGYISVINAASSAYQDIWLTILPQWCENHGFSGLFWDTLGDVGPTLIFGADKLVFDGMDYLDGTKAAMAATYQEYVIEAEYLHHKLMAYIFATWEGPRMWLNSEPPQVVDHPLRAALVSSYVWTMDVKLTWGALDITTNYDFHAAALMGCIPEFCLSGDYQAPLVGNDWFTARAKLYSKFELFHDLPSAWVDGILAYFRSNTGSLFRFEDRGSDVYAYVEEHPTIGDYDRLVIDAGTIITNNIDEDLPSSYTRGSYISLPSDDTDLATPYNIDDIADVATDDTDMVAQLATSQIAIHQFKQEINGVGGTITVVAQVTIPCSTSTTYLQIYNRNGTPAWDTIDSDNATGANTDFTLSATVADLTDYKDENNIVACRVYQEMQ